MRRGCALPARRPGLATGLVGGAFALGLLALRWAVVATIVLSALCVAALVWAGRRVAGYLST